MEAKTFITKKHDAAADELRAIDAEYIPRRNAALAAIAMTQSWLDELAVETTPAKPEHTIQNVVELAVEARSVEPRAVQQVVSEVVFERGSSHTRVSPQDAIRNSSENWISARDLLPKVRQAS